MMMMFAPRPRPIRRTRHPPWASRAVSRATSISGWPSRSAARIISGYLQPHTPLPAERRLADEYGVSLGTARRATELLRERGLVVTLRSKGTYITDRTQDR